jgi:tetratricopeptide (TPR) repeat protein
MRKLATVCLVGLALTHLGALPASAQAAGRTPADTDTPQAMKAQAEHCDDARQYDCAIKLYSRVIQLMPDSEVIDARGNAFLQTGAYDRALADYMEAIRLDPNNAQAFIDRGVAYYMKGDFEKAVADYSEAIRLNTTNSAVFSNRAAAYSKLKREDLALADDNEAIRRSPDIADYYNDRGLTYAALHDYDRAIADFNEAIRREPRANYLTNRGDSYQYKNDYDRAIADYDAALKLNPKFWMAYNNRGAAYRSKHDLDRAIANYEQAVRLNPRDDTAADNLKAVRRDRDRLALVNPHVKPLFDCATAKRAVEKAICSDAELVRLDRDMNTAFQEALARLSGAKAAALRQEQRAFIAKRDRMFGRPSYQLKQEMRRRELELTALVRDDRSDRDGC